MPLTLTASSVPQPIGRYATEADMPLADVVTVRQGPFACPA